MTTNSTNSTNTTTAAVEPADVHAAFEKALAPGGWLRKTAPRDPDVYAAWVGAMMVCNPYKVSPGKVMMMSARSRAIMDAVESALMARRARDPGVVMLDRDRAQLTRWGVW
jgi:hypothetical protein